jgi:hypothetical protein
MVSGAALCTYKALTARLSAMLLNDYSPNPPSAVKLWGVLRGETLREPLRLKRFTLSKSV